MKILSVDGLYVQLSMVNSVSVGLGGIRVFQIMTAEKSGDQSKRVTFAQ